MPSGNKPLEMGDYFTSSATVFFVRSWRRCCSVALLTSRSLFFTGPFKCTNHGAAYLCYGEQLASSGLPRVDTHRTTSVVDIRRALHCATAASRVLGRHYDAKRRSGLRATAGAVVAATRRRGGVVAWASTKEGLAWGQAAAHVERYCACNPSFPTPLLPRLS